MSPPDAPQTRVSIQADLDLAETDLPSQWRQENTSSGRELAAQIRAARRRVWRVAQLIADRGSFVRIEKKLLVKATTSIFSWGDKPTILALAAHHLGGVAGAHQVIEKPFSLDDWRVIVSYARPGDILECLSRRAASGLWLEFARCWAAAMEKCADLKVALGNFSATLVPAGHVYHDGSPERDLLIAVALARVSETDMTSDQVARWRHWITKGVADEKFRSRGLPEEALNAVARVCLDRSTAATLIADHKPPVLVERLEPILPAIASFVADQIAARLKPLWWQDEKPESQFIRTYELHSSVQRIVTRCGPYLVGFLGPEVAFEAAIMAEKAGQAPDDADCGGSLLAEMHVDIADGVGRAILIMSAMWLTLRKIRGYGWGHETEKLGLEHLLQRMAEEHTDQWAAILALVLRKANEELSVVVAITTLLVDGHPNLRAALKEAGRSLHANVRDRARGILALSDEPRSTGKDLDARVLSILARRLDGRPAFPHPLRLPSSTWLASEGVERIIRDGAERAQRAFSAFCSQSLDTDEEPLTERLLTEIELAFRDSDLSLPALGGGPRSNPIRVERRLLSKHEEGRKDDVRGFDVAFLLRGDVPGALEIESVELIQVKKALRDGRTGYRDAWGIKLSQLDALIGHSQTACFWLFGPEGEVHIAPARLLRAIAKGRKVDHQGSMTVWYHEIRSMTIPLSQFLVDLFVGVWIGTSEKKAVSYARGESETGKPWQVFEVTVHFGQRG